MEMVLECLPGMLGFSYLLGVHYAESRIEKKRVAIATKMHWNVLPK